MGVVAIDWGGVVGVCEDDLLCQAAHVTIAKPLGQRSAGIHCLIGPQESSRFYSTEQSHVEGC